MEFAVLADIPIARMYNVAQTMVNDGLMSEHALRRLRYANLVYVQRRGARAISTQRRIGRWLFD